MTSRATRFLGWLKHLLADLVEATRHLPEVVPHRPALGRWLLRSHKAQIALVVGLLFGFLAVAPAAEWIGEAIFPPKVVRKVFKKRKKVDPAAATIENILLGVHWTAVGLTTLALLWLELPRAASWYGRRRREADATVAVADVSTAPTVHSESALVEGLPKPGAGMPEVPGGRYVIDSVLGQGGMGVVFRARDTVLEREVALKSLSSVLMKNETLVARFKQEARVLAGFSHPGIVQVHDLVEAEDTIYMAMELVDGRDLAEVIEERGALPQGEALELAAVVADAVAHAHEKGIVHRDLKPHNVLLTTDGVTKVTDFGLAKGAESAGLTQAGSLLGSPNYIAPEQASGGETDARSDVYSFGCTLFEMVTGRPPFVGEVANVILGHVSHEPPRPSELAPEVDPRVEELIAAMMAKDPTERMQSMRQVERRLVELAREIA
jgi:tRNA A-37 threonylcarbamoyl transferase component Bud32